MEEHEHKRALSEIAREKQERGARRAILEDLFYDFHKSRHQVYAMNFLRGIFFGFGTVIGGTVVVLLVIWVLSLLDHFFPFIDGVIKALQTRV